MKIIECPRDAMQGLSEFIPTDLKVEYLNNLLKVGFDTIDFGSFVSHKAVPQMKDTAKVLAQLDFEETTSKLLAIVANKRGAEEAVEYEQVSYLGYPLSISETFQQRNTNASIADSLVLVHELQELCAKHDKTLVIYLSMGFGNPYGEPWSPDIVADFVRKLYALEISIVALSDTIGTSSVDTISQLFTTLIPAYPSIEFGAHLHTNPKETLQKIGAVYDSGCRRIDAAIMGFGGCPFAEDELVGNVPTESIVAYLEKNGLKHDLSLEAFSASVHLASRIFPH